MVYTLSACKATLVEGSSAADHANQPQTAGDGSIVNDADGSPPNAAENGDGISTSQTESVDGALAAAHAGNLSTVDALPPMMIEESESIPDVPIRFRVRNTMHILSAYPHSGSLGLEPSSSTNQDIPMAAEGGPTERKRRQPHDSLEEPQTHSGQPGADPFSTPVIAESQTSAPKPRKRRRKGPRLTRVKNERVKKAQARAKAKAKGKENAVEPQVEVTAPLESTEVRDEPVRRTRRAMARATEHAEGSGTIESARRSGGKGKAKSKDLPSDDGAATGSKRKRCTVDANAEGAPQGEPGDAGPSRPTRRTRQKLQAPADEETPLPPPTHRTRAVTRAAATAATEATGPARGTKRYRSLAPEPSEGRIDAERKRARLASPERLDDSHGATSSRVILDRSKTSIKIEEAGREVPCDDPMDNNVVVEEPVQVQSDPVIAVDSERESADAGSEPPPADSSEKGQGSRPSGPPPWPPLQTPNRRRNAFLPPHAPDPPPEIDLPEHLRYLPVPQPHIPPSPMPPFGMFPPPLAGNRLRRHETTMIGHNVYRPDDPYYFLR